MRRALGLLVTYRVQRGGAPSARGVSFRWNWPARM